MIKVLVVDDSALVRKILSEELSKHASIEVVGTAVDPYAARDKIVKLSPDVITLDLEMPRMDGLTFLTKLMTYHPMPVVVVSSLAPENSGNALKALELGAVEVLCKPGSAFSTPDISSEIVRAVRLASKARIKRHDAVQERQPGPSGPRDVQVDTSRKVIVMGASTGGTQALESVLSALPSDSPGIAVVQHMPPYFTATFASRLNALCSLEVREARDKDRLSPGLVLIAPGGMHLVLQKSGAYYQVGVKDGPQVHHQRPSVDVLFQSAAAVAGPNAIGVLMTGMGCDGAVGLLEMRNRGAQTIAQDEESCVVYGMPGEAVKLGAACQVAPLWEIPGAVLRAVGSGTKREKGTKESA